MKKYKIFIVEDDRSLLSALKEKFSSAKYQVISALNGKEGLKKIKKEKPDIILLDILMPVMDGITMLRKLKEDEKCAKIPVIILTNLDDNQKVQEALENEAYDYLIKSDWSIDDVAKKVEEKLFIG